MAVEEWRKPVPQMQREAISALAELASGRQQAQAPLRETAALVTIAAHQVPALVEAGAFRPGDLDDEAMQAMAVVVDIAAAWDPETEGIESFVGGLDEDDLMRLASASALWAKAVWDDMVPLPEAEKARLVAGMRN